MTKHFRVRVMERGPQGIDPDLVTAIVMQAIAAHDESVAERIMDGRGPGVGIYRLFLEWGRYYAVCRDDCGRPLTFLTQEQIWVLKDAVHGRARSVHRALLAEEQRRERREWRRRRARVKSRRR